MKRTSLVAIAALLCAFGPLAPFSAGRASTQQAGAAGRPPSVPPKAASAGPADVWQMNQKLRAEETNNSKIMWLVHEISDVHGPRLTGSPGLRAAQDRSEEHTSELQSRS